jgi:hypothetical protein
MYVLRQVDDGGARHFIHFARLSFDSLYEIANGRAKVMSVKIGGSTILVLYDDLSAKGEISKPGGARNRRF